MDTGDGAGDEAETAPLAEGDTDTMRCGIARNGATGTVRVAGSPAGRTDGRSGAGRPRPTTGRADSVSAPESRLPPAAGSNTAERRPG